MILEQINSFLKNIFQWWVLISPWEQGIRIYLGKHIKLLEPGFHLRLPIVHKIFIQSIRVRSQNINSQTLLTKDGHTITVASSLQYEIKNLLNLYQTLHHPFETVEQITQGIISEYFYINNLSEINQTNGKLYILKHLKIERFGLELIDFNFTSFAKAKTYRIITGEISSYSDYDYRLETNFAFGESKNR